MIKKLFTYIFIFLMVFAFLMPPVSAKTIADIEREIEAAEKKLNDTNTKKAINNQNLEQTKKRIQEIENNIVQVEKSIEDKTKESEKLAEDIKKKNAETKDLMRYYEVSSSGSAMLEYVMGAESLTDLIYRLSITEQISSYNKKLVDQMNEMIEKNEKIKKDLEKEKENLNNLKKEQETQSIVLSQKQSELDAEGESEEQVVKGMRNELNYYKKLGCDSNESITACTNRVFGDTTLPVGTTFRRPTTSGRISSEFGNRTLNGKPNKHFAIDIAMPTGTPVYAVAPGVVGYTGDICGISLVLWHNVNGKTYSSIYCHLSKQLVKKGQVVTADTVIAKSGCTGQCYGAHLHLGMATGRYKDIENGYSRYYSSGRGDSLEEHTFDPRDVIIFPALGQSYYNR